MNDYKNPYPIIPPIKGDPAQKEYYCPFCKEMIMKGNIKHLRMPCPNCCVLINVDESELIKAS